MLRRSDIIIYPVITKIPSTIQVIKGKKKADALSRMARDSAKVSALRSNLRLGSFEKDDAGIPVSSDGVFWSISHKPRIVAGVVSTKRIGIDIEQIKPVTSKLIDRILDPKECQLFEGVERSTAFFRVFTAKEAVLKKTGDGIMGLAQCRIVKVMDESNLQIQYLNKNYFVENFYFDGYLASVTKDDCHVQWAVI